MHRFVRQPLSHSRPRLHQAKPCDDKHRAKNFHDLFPRLKFTTALCSPPFAKAPVSTGRSPGPVALQARHRKNSPGSASRFGVSGRAKTHHLKRTKRARLYRAGIVAVRSRVPPGLLSCVATIVRRDGNHEPKTMTPPDWVPACRRQAPSFVVFANCGSTLQLAALVNGHTVILEPTETAASPFRNRS